MKIQSENFEDGQQSLPVGTNSNSITIENHDALYNYVWNQAYIEIYSTEFLIHDIGNRYDKEIMKWFENNNIKIQLYRPGGFRKIELSEEDYVFLCMKYL